MSIDQEVRDRRRGDAGVEEEKRFRRVSRLTLEQKVVLRVGVRTGTKVLEQ